MIYFTLLSFILCSSLHNVQTTYWHAVSNELQLEIFINATTKYIKWQNLSMEHWINLHSNNYSYKKQMFLLNDKLYTLLFGCVITAKKPTHININMNKNKINCIPSFKNITSNTLITEPQSKSTYQSTNGPEGELTHAHINTQSGSLWHSIECEQLLIVACKTVIMDIFNLWRFIDPNVSYLYTNLATKRFETFAII